MALPGSWRWSYPRSEPTVWRSHYLAENLSLACKDNQGEECIGTGG